MENIQSACKVDSYFNSNTFMKRKTQKEIIFNAIKFFGTVTQRIISDATGIPRHLIPDRINKLLEENKIVIAGKTKDKFTKQFVTQYKIKEN